MRNGDWFGSPHEPCEKTTSGWRPFATSASCRNAPAGVPVPSAAGYQTCVASTRGAPVVTDVVVISIVVNPTGSGPGWV